MSEPVYIHTVTVIPYHPNDPAKLVHFFPRCWGFYATREKARNGLLALVDDECGYYTHAIIERYQDGIYAHCDQEEWYAFDFEKKSWQPCPKPEFSEFTVNYAIG
jgi:hypothetical protein